MCSRFAKVAVYILKIDRKLIVSDAGIAFDSLTFRYAPYRYCFIS